MTTWQSLDSTEGVNSIIAASYERPQVIFKHSTSCSISSVAKMRLEDDWSIPSIKPYLLDLIAYRNVSNYIADALNVHHESPQVIVIHDGEAILEDSHLDIRMSEIEDIIKDI